MSDPGEFLAVALDSPFELDDTLATFGARTVAAHRELLELHKPTTYPYPFMAGSYVSCGHCMGGHQEHLDWPCPTVEILAEAYGWTPA